MTTWTVISTIAAPDEWTGVTSADIIAAVSGRAEVYGLNVHTATVDADTADQAIAKVRDAYRIVGRITPNADTRHTANGGP